MVKLLHIDNNGFFQYEKDGKLVLGKLSENIDENEILSNTREVPKAVIPDGVSYISEYKSEKLLIENLKKHINE